MNDTILKKALASAYKAFAKDEVPVGAVVFHSETGQVIASAFNQTEQKKDPLAHAEILAIQRACRKVGDKRLNGYSIFVTLEPCAMCAGAISLARLDGLYFGALDPKTGAVNQGACVFTHKQTHHKPTIQGGMGADDCASPLIQFFKQKRGKRV